VAKREEPERHEQEGQEEDVPAADSEDDQRDGHTDRERADHRAASAEVLRADI
jgi:hypothetical protein